MSSTDMRGLSGTSSVSRATDDRHVMDLRMTRDGAPFTADWLLGAALEGRVFCAQAGLLSTAITWTATATNDQTKPAVFLSVPSGTTIIPVSIELYMEAFGTTAQFECEAITGTGGVSASGTAMVITNMRTDAPVSSTCTATSDITGGTACTANVNAFWRDGQQFAITKSAGSATAAASDPNKFAWKLSDSMVAPVVKGPGQLMVTQGSQAGTGFCKVVFVEIPSNEFF